MIERGLYYATADFAQMIKSAGGDNQHYIIKNQILIAELERKLFRILSAENSQPNKFRQHITDVKHHLLAELADDSKSCKDINAANRKSPET